MLTCNRQGVTYDCLQVNDIGLTVEMRKCHYYKFWKCWTENSFHLLIQVTISQYRYMLWKWLIDDSETSLRMYQFLGMRRRLLYKSSYFPGTTLVYTKRGSYKVQGPRVNLLIYDPGAATTGITILSTDPINSMEIMRRRWRWWSIEPVEKGKFRRS